MTFGVIGAGLQGCAVALELASRGERVLLLERGPQPMDGASRWNEGKIHLGYVYAHSGGLRTARAMVAAAAVFGRFVSRHLECPVERVARSSPFVYAVHRDSMLPADAIEAYFGQVDDLIASTISTGDYLGQARLDRVREIAVESSFDPRFVRRAFATPELSIDPHALADSICARLRDDPAIELRTSAEIRAIERRTDGRFLLHLAGGERIDGIDQIVNASWESRLALDASAGYAPPRSWLHRFKLAVHVGASATRAEWPSATFVLGPFGDVVCFGDGRCYLSWYPACRIDSSTDIAPRDRSPIPPGGFSDVRDRTFEALSALFPALRDVETRVPAAVVRGGWIFAWGDGEISHPLSGLHERYDVGSFSDRGYHSINTGKYGMAPLHAIELCDRLVGSRVTSSRCT